MNRAIFIALADVIDDPDACAALEGAFSTVVVATDRRHAVTELTALGETVQAAIIGVKERIDARVLEAVPQLRVLGSLSVGTDHLDLTALADRDVQVITTPGVNAVSVAEHALMMIFALAKRMLPAHAAVATGQDRAGMLDPPVEVRGRRIGVLGAGATARALIPLAQALGMEAVVWTRHPDRHPDLRTATLEEIFGECDVISIHLPLTAQTRGLVGARLLRLLPFGAFVVNVARKEIVDSDGLRAVVADRPDLWFAIDDFGLAGDGTVAAVGDQGLWSPHIAGVTVEASAAMQDVVVRAVVRRAASTGKPRVANGDQDLSPGTTLAISAAVATRPVSWIFVAILSPSSTPWSSGSRRTTTVSNSATPGLVTGTRCGDWWSGGGVAGRRVCRPRGPTACPATAAARCPG